MRASRRLFAGFVARMEDTKLPKCVMFGESVGAQAVLGGLCWAGCAGGQEKEWMGCFLDDLRPFRINTDQWTSAAQDEGEWRKAAEHGAELSWRNGSLQRKPGVDYGMQSYART